MALTTRHCMVSETVSLLSLPNELLLTIIDFLDHHRPLYAVARACRRLYHLFRRYLLRYNVRYSKGSALIWAAQKDRRTMVRRLLRLGAQVNTRGEPQRHGTALHVATKAGSMGMVELLLKNGGDPEVCGSKGFTPLFVALWHGHEEIAIVLFRNAKGPDSQIAGDAGYTPLHVACRRQLPNSARVFLEAGADVHATTARGHTSLHLALQYQVSDGCQGTTQSSTLAIIMLLFEFGSRKDVKAHRLGGQHPDPQVRALFQRRDSGTRLTNTETRETALLFMDKDLFDDMVFPPLRPLQRSREQHRLTTSGWDPAKVQGIAAAMLNSESPEAEGMDGAGPPVDPFPKLIGRNSPHPLECAAQLSWRHLAKPRMRDMAGEACAAPESTTQDAKSQAKQASKKRR